jgi:hypothetical protein
MKYAIFCVGDDGIELMRSIVAKGIDEVVCFVDNSSSKHGQYVDNIPIKYPDELRKVLFDYIYVNISYLDEISAQLKTMGIGGEYLISYGGCDSLTRLNWLRDFSKLANTKYETHQTLCVAEAGVFRGAFAKEINRSFPDHTLYLFDTFEGFAAKDVECEILPSAAASGHFDATSINLVMSKMPFPEKVVIKKGYFPETTKGIREDFCFVNLDMDLYKPTFEGLKFFYPQLISGGVILIHDYFGESYPNVKTAVADFQNYQGYNLLTVPIGDRLSIAIIKP